MKYENSKGEEKEQVKDSYERHLFEKNLSRNQGAVVLVCD